MSKCRKEREHPVTTFTVTDCGNDRQLQDFVNRATDGDTITFACSGTITLTSTLNIKGKGVSTAGLTVNGNWTAVVRDGIKLVGVFRVEGMYLSLKGLTIINGRAERGGGLFNTGGKVSITNCTFRGNTAQHGGGLFNREGKVSITNGTFSDNETAGSGGGLYNQKGEMSLSRCTFSGNTAQHGGGLGNEGPGRVTITNCTVCGNTARGWGGGFSNNFGCDATISFSTFVNNTASVAGGLTTGYPPLRITATIVANNTAQFSKQQNGSGKMTSLGFNLESGDDCDFTPMPTDQHNLDPALDPVGLQNNGGPTQTIALQPGSPAIGAVTDTTLCPGTDQRGWLRQPGIIPCDIGAYHSSYLPPPAPPSP